MTVPNRGEAWWIDTSDGEKPYLIVSNPLRNRSLQTVLAVRITTSPNPPDIASVVAITDRGSIVGRALCDEIVLVDKNDLKRQASHAFTPRQMESICKGIRAAVACP